MSTLSYFAIIAAVLITGCGKSEHTEQVVHVTNTSTTAIKPVEERFMPEFSKDTLGGESLTNQSLKGKLTVVNFWATWCGPCVIETPALVALRNEWKDRGFEVVGVSMDEEGLDVVDEFAKRFDISYPLIHDLGSLADEFGGVYALPTSYLVDPSGKIIHRIIGVFPVEDLREEMESYLTESLSP